MIAVIANDIQRKELTESGLADDQQVVWIAEPQVKTGISIYIDLLFDDSPERIKILGQLPATCIIINHVAGTLAGMPANFVRFNGWPTFLKRQVAECSTITFELCPRVKKAFSAFSKKVIFPPDVPGFVSVRIIASIINEAYISLEEGVSTREETDTAMKTGTNYPYGPFEWAELIGISSIYKLLHKMAAANSRYIPAALLSREASTAWFFCYILILPWKPPPSASLKMLRFLVFQ